MTYKYNKKKYFITVTLTSIFIVFLLIYAVIKNIFDFNINIYTFIILASCYELFNIYIAGVKPLEIELDSQKLIMRGYHKEDVYEIQDLKYTMLIRGKASLIITVFQISLNFLVVCLVIKPTNFIPLQLTISFQSAILI